MTRTRKRSRGAKYPNRLWRYRRRMGFSQPEVAGLMGYLTPTDLSKFEKGERVPSLVTALKLEIVYRVPLSFLYQDLYLRLRDQLREKEERLRHGQDGAAAA